MGGDVSGDRPGRRAEAAVGAVSRRAALRAQSRGPGAKSDVGGVLLNLRSHDEVGQAYRGMSARIGQEMTGAVVQRMLPAGVEIIVGGSTTRRSGRSSWWAWGGVTADLPADRAFRVPPVTDATDMIGELHCAPLLRGYRGSRPWTSRAWPSRSRGSAGLLEDLPQVAELDLNPVIVTPDGATTVDARIRVAPCEPPPSPLLRRLR
ncbi:acetate--CoA ligase family protein [Nonomuraea basaltis]|uniref:acetate--CoA ligase family protein n=1 Tax=Nonomuraea basaltis TaxID=2495887 RepID=UPI0014862314|nr:acetate--CoA ligase family protein [Nonomuraea basaltis]